MPTAHGLALASPAVLDHVLLVLITLVWPLIDRLWSYPRLVRASAAGVPGARSRVYLAYLTTAWGLTVAVLALWAIGARPWGALPLGFGTPLRSAAGLVVVAAYLGLGWAQWRALVARPEHLARVLNKAASAEPLLPHTPRERAGFALVALSAGVCEEVLFRGFVMWYLAAWGGPLLAVAGSSLLFGFGHLYLGVRDFYRTTLGGLFFALLTLVTGALWPAVLIHAFADLASGELAYRARRGPPADHRPGELAA
jgi:CAAX protease family protein